MKTVVKDFTYRGRHYVIVNDGKYYMTVERTHIGEDGRLTKELHYGDGLHTNETLDGCIADTKADLDVKHYISEGMSKGEAYCKAFNITDPEQAKVIAQIFA